MRHLAITITMLVAVIFMACPEVHAKSKAKTANIEFQTKIHDFGTVPAKGSVTAEFQFTNTGDANLVITQADSECGCTKPTYPENPIAPGKQGTITVKYTPAGHTGYFEKSITVRTNGEPKKVKLKIKGEVER